MTVFPRLLAAADRQPHWAALACAALAGLTGWAGPAIVDRLSALLS